MSEREEIMICPVCGRKGKIKIAGSCSCGDPKCDGGKIIAHTKTIAILSLEGSSVPSCEKCGAIMDREGEEKSDEDRAIDKMIELTGGIPS